MIHSGLLSINANFVLRTGVTIILAMRADGYFWSILFKPIMWGAIRTLLVHFHAGCGCLVHFHAGCGWILQLRSLHLLLVMRGTFLRHLNGWKFWTEVESRMNQQIYHLVGSSRQQTLQNSRGLSPLLSETLCLHCHVYRGVFGLQLHQLIQWISTKT